MEPEKALELVKHGSTLLLLDVPQYTLIGIDTQVFSVGPAFKGIKMIPPGVHFIFYSSSNRDGKEFSPIIGFFIETSPSKVVVRKWNPEEERLIKVPEEEEERYAQAVKCLEFDRQLGPYLLDEYGDWKRLSNFITKDVIERIEPIGGEITVASESMIYGDLPKTPMEQALAEQLKGSKFSSEVTSSEKKGCYYTPIPRVIKQKGICGAELTSLNLDKTHILEAILKKEYDNVEDRLLGELQFAFIAFLMGQSLEGFLQWKSLVSLLLQCVEAPFRTRSQLFTKFIKCVYYQLKYGFQRDHTGSTGIGKEPSILLDDSWFSADSFLHHLCKDFFSLVGQASVIDGDLLTWTRKLKELLEETLGWEFQQKSAVDGLYFEEGDEYAPVVEMLEDTN
uniref:Protein AAR2 homolog n=1 Tax=Opuntia streptacantha TaxID=393608 RepID=A0A7C8ZTH8_OPUST